MTTSLEPEKSGPLFEWANRQWEQLLAYHRPIEIPSRTAIYFPDDQADALLVVLKGRVVIGAVLEAGRKCWLRFVHRGEFFGEQSLIPGARRLQYAESLLPSQIAVIEAKRMRSFIEQDATFALGIAQSLSQQLINTNHLWSRQFLQPMRDRLMMFLLDFALHDGLYVGSDVVIDLDLTHEDLAGFVGASRESVSIQLAQLRKNDLLTSSRRRIKLLSPAT